MLTERDKYILAILQDGPLSSYQIYKFTEHLKVNHYYLIKRLKKLREDGLIFKPPGILNPSGVTGRYYMYALTDKGRDALGELRNRFAVPTTGGWPHMAMAASIVQNIRHYAGDRFISQEDILKAHLDEPVKNPLLIETTISQKFVNKHGDVRSAKARVIPDQLFGIKYGSDHYRFFPVEADRGSYTHTTLRQKIREYRNIIENRLYEEPYGVPCLFPIFITTSEDRAQALQKDIEEIFPNNQFILVGWIPGFVDYDTSPKLFPELWERPYLRARKPFLLSQP